ncbi:MAG: ABC transporter substrate-binding protein [Actinomycetia bacterium]|nr:ABC transporter substrate-binding protein [Actinomycetes bacterium]
MNHDQSTRRRLWRFLAVIAALSLFTAACSGSSDDDAGSPDGDSSGSDSDASTGGDDAGPSGQAQAGGELSVGIVSESNSWYPPEAEWAFAAGNLVADAFYENLYTRNGEGDILPQLAASDAVPNDDASQWTVTVRSGITFHDGTALDADALVDMGQLWSEGRFATPGEGVEEVVKVDDMTVAYVLHEPDPAFPATLAGNRGVAFSPTAARFFGEDAAENPVGTGPFIFREWTRDSEVVLTRNPNYWQEGQPLLDRIRFRVLVDVNSRVASLEAGDVDIISQGGVDGLTGVEDNGFRLYDYRGNGAGLVIYNTLNPPFDDVRVRRAASAAIDPEDIEALSPGSLTGETEYRSHYFSPNSPWHSPEADDAAQRFDIDQAQALVDEYVNDADRSDGQGVGDPISFTYVCNPIPANRLTSQYLLQAWGDVGMEVELLEEEQATMVTRVIGAPTSDPPFLGDFQASCWADGSSNDPLVIFDTRYGAVADNVLNWTNYTSPDVDAQVELLRNSLDFDTRYSAAAEISRITTEAATQFWYSSGSTNVVVSPDVGGIDDYTWPDGTPGTRQDRGRVHWNTVWVEGAEPLDVSMALIEVPEDFEPEEPEEPEEEPEEVALPTDEAALAVLPGLDSLPASFVDNEPNYVFEQCPGFAPLDSVNPVSISERAFKAPGDFGPYVSFLILDLPEGEADLYMDTYAASAVGDCQEYDSVAASGAPLHFATETLEADNLGDRTDGWALRGDSAGFPVNADLVFTRVGNRLAITSWLAIGSTPDLATTNTLAAEVHTALAGLG